MEAYQDFKAYSSLKAKTPVDALVKEAISNPGLIEQYLKIIDNAKGGIKFGAEKVIRLVSESRPELVYPFFQEIAGLIDSENSFIKWGGIITLSNLAGVDELELFPGIFERYFDLLNDRKMVTAANVAGNAWKIAKSYPELEPEITRRLIRAVDNVYYYKEEPSPECNNVLRGHIIDCFDRYFEESRSKDKIIEFVRNQLANSRKKVVLKAESFFKRHERSA
ncbi:MAG: hypothetical protein PHI41_07345 [Erysipelotrichaceae bacterium]|nr:hypothetical protein [Erysipelotrichaceae bacterium]MDD3809339.1 hypothetical protein [Erysipelotrichaceae bacterium]